MAHNRLAFVSGPIKGEHGAAGVFSRVAAELRDEGFDVVNPCDLPGDPETATGDEHRSVLRWCVARVTESNLVVALPGWERSRGARLEVFVAAEIGIPIRFQTV